jgi:Uma2 family endonuclease
MKTKRQAEEESPPDFNIANPCFYPYTVNMSEALEPGYYTYADYLEWDEDFRAEIIDGELYMMATPSRFHQSISMALSARIYNFLLGKTCKVYVAPFTVRLFPRRDGSDDTVLEPDITVVCDPSKLDKQGCAGAPDMVVEILSPSTARNDKIAKLRKYQKAGVKELWIIDPDAKTLDTYILDRGSYLFSIYDESEKVPVLTLPGLEIDLSEIFAE